MHAVCGRQVSRKQLLNMTRMRMQLLWMESLWAAKRV